ncbi:MAG: glycosyltransferase family 39 protein [Deltaproteobacteria bacterium]|nr:glycosyltransferase family 39 protein [Nannocystaceae bacterium]
MSRRLVLLAIVLGVLVTALLSIGHREVGYVRDEGIYFAASRSYAAWFGDLVRQPGKTLGRAERDRRFRTNHEHPALLKSLAGLSARLLARPPAAGSEEPGIRDDGGVLPVMDEGAAMRLPAQLSTALAVALLFLAASRWWGVGAGVLAAGSFILLPQVWFYAGLHAFDVPVAVAMLVVVLAYRRALHSRGWALALGPIVGVAIAVKHNALFLGPLLALHYWTCLLLARVREGRPIARGQWIPLPLVSMGLSSLPVAVALWPWLWSDTWARIAEYVTFHRAHAYYNMEFLGTNYNQPPMPIAYPWVMTWASVPSVILVIAALGLALGLRAELARDREPSTELARGGFVIALPGGWARHDTLLFAMMAVFPLVLIALPSTPIFGGTKHWITAYPFMALLSARAWPWLWSRLTDVRTARLEPLALAVVLGPAAIATIDGHPYGMSQYAPLVGGARGAASLGLNRGFWGHAIVRELPRLPELMGDATRLYAHDLDGLAQRQYVREGRWPAGIEMVPLSRAQAGLFFHELHMATWEYQLWEQLGTTAPVDVVTLDGVPLTSVYARKP